MHSKKKIVNDPVYGFINLPSGLIFELIEHPYFQRLRRIRQLGLSYLVYPGAIHSRFQHSIGAMHLMSEAINVLVSKGVEITDEEKESVMIAILLHDIGHAPFSHSLENSIIESMNHEDISLKFMNALNKQFGGSLDLAIRIFKNEYSKRFLHQLVSGQLDMDRLDYLRRDSFFTGVSEGVIGSDRIIKMLNVHKDQLVVDAKGIYSVEKFLIARRLMYWQVYMHKTALAAELVLMKIFKRIKDLFLTGKDFYGFENLSYFLTNKFSNDEVLVEKFASIDDYDVYHLIKKWAESNDKVLKDLSQAILNRKLPKLILSKEMYDSERLEVLEKKFLLKSGYSKELTHYYVFPGNVSNKAYSVLDDKINILFRDKISDISEASDILNMSILSKVIKKYYVCAPKDLF